MSVERARAAAQARASSTSVAPVPPSTGRAEANASTASDAPQQCVDGILQHRAARARAQPLAVNDAHAAQSALARVRAESRSAALRPGRRSGRADRSRTRCDTGHGATGAARSRARRHGGTAARRPAARRSRSSTGRRRGSRAAPRRARRARKCARGVALRRAGGARGARFSGCTSRIARRNSSPSSSSGSSSFSPIAARSSRRGH